MPTNQFSSFGLAGGAYVYAPATWAANPKRSTGYPPGLLLKEELNTPLRQSAFVISNVAQFMADQSGLAINDNGDQAQFIDRYKIATRNFAAGQRYPIDTGAANAYVVALDPVVTAAVHGMEVAFIATHSCTGPSTLDVGFGPEALGRIDGSALLEQDIVAGSTVSCIYDNASSKWIITSVLVNQLNRTAAWRYITGPTQLTVGAPYLVNTIAGSFDVTLPANPVAGDAITFIDATAWWGENTFTILRNGHTIMARAEDLIVNVNDQMFSMWFKETNDWRLV